MLPVINMLLNIQAINAYHLGKNLCKVARLLNLRVYDFDP